MLPPQQPTIGHRRTNSDYLTITPIRHNDTNVTTATATATPSRSPSLLDAPQTAPLMHRRLSSHSNLRQSRHDTRTPAAARFKRASSTSALSSRYQASAISTTDGDSSVASICPTLLRSLSAKSGLSYPALDTACSEASSMSTRSRTSSVSTLSDLLPILSSRRSTLSVASLDDDDNTPSTPSEDPFPSLAPTSSFLAAPLKRARSSTVNDAVGHSKKTSTPQSAAQPPLVEATSRNRLSLNINTFKSLSRHGFSASSPPSAEPTLSPTSPIVATPPAPPISIKPLPMLLPLPTLRPDHLSYITQIIIAYDSSSASESVSSCKKLIIFLTKLAKASGNPSTFKHVTEFKESGRSTVSIVYTDKSYIRLYPDAQPYDVMLGQIGVHAQALLDERENRQ